MKKIFISFAKEDMYLRDFLKGQAKNDNSPFDYIDMSVKEPWDSKWKTYCRERIKYCSGLIAIVTPNTKYADGQLWEIKCAKELGIPVLGIYGHRDHVGSSLPSSCGQIKIVGWTWKNISDWLFNL